MSEIPRSEGASSSSHARSWDRVAGLYDLYTAPMEWMGGRARRRRALAPARGRLLEVGVGTGANLDLYPEGVDLTGIDISGEMIARAHRRAEKSGIPVRLEVADAERLPFPDASFDTVAATCVFCSVGDPVQGLREVHRVTRPDGQVLLLEHVRPRNPLMGKLFDLVSPVVRRLFGPKINRRTEENVRAAGLEIVDVRREGIWREIRARPTRPGGETE
jgi:ubiquinone/menaquinone biosynthesis C-methylase UbiE